MNRWASLCCYKYTVIIVFFYIEGRSTNECTWNKFFISYLEMLCFIVPTYGQAPSHAVTAIEGTYVVVWNTSIYETSSVWECTCQSANEQKKFLLAREIRYTMVSGVHCINIWVRESALQIFVNHGAQRYHTLRILPVSYDECLGISELLGSL